MAIEQITGGDLATGGGILGGLLALAGAAYPSVKAVLGWLTERREAREKRDDLLRSEENKYRENQTELLKETVTTLVKFQSGQAEVIREVARLAMEVRELGETVARMSNKS